MRKSLYAMNLDEIMEELNLEKKFQARIVRDNLVKGITDFSQMTSLSKKDRERLRWDAMTTSIVEKQESLSAVKLAIRLQDGLVVECVRLSDGKDAWVSRSIISVPLWKQSISSMTESSSISLTGR